LHTTRQNGRKYLPDFTAGKICTHFCTILCYDGGLDEEWKQEEDEDEEVQQQLNIHASLIKNSFNEPKIINICTVIKQGYITRINTVTDGKLATDKHLLFECVFIKGTILFCMPHFTKKYRNI
jgi:hypothetical protein